MSGVESIVIGTVIFLIALPDRLFACQILPASPHDMLTDRCLHSVNMCTLATEQTSNWLMVDAWEAFQTYQRTAVVLDHFEYEINDVLGGVRSPSGEQRRVRVILLAGSDLIGTMSQPGVWSERDVRCPALQLPIAEHRPLTCAYAARSHFGKIRHVHHRACGFGHGPGD